LLEADAIGKIDHIEPFRARPHDRYPAYTHFADI